MHYQFSQIKSVLKGENSPSLFLLKGDSFDPPFAGLFEYSLSKIEETVSMMTENTKNAPEQNEKVEIFDLKVVE